LNSPFIVKFVTFEFTRLLDSNNQYHPNIKVADALTMAKNQGLDLVCFNKAQGTDLTFCKILDYNKWLYSEEKRKKKQQKNSRKETKEIRLTPMIAENDIAHKMRSANEFLDEGNDVVLVMKLRGRERAHMGEAEIKMNEVVKFCEGHGREISRKKSDGMIIVRLAK